MTITDVAQVAANAGFQGANLPIAIAVAMAESGGNPNAHCLNCGGVPEDSRGIWQVNVNAHPQYASVNLYDPATNAQAAYALSGGSDFSAWSTFTGGAYQAYLTQAQAAANAVVPNPTRTPPTFGQSAPIGALLIGGLIALELLEAL